MGGSGAIGSTLLRPAVSDNPVIAHYYPFRAQTTTAWAILFSVPTSLLAPQKKFAQANRLSQWHTSPDNPHRVDDTFAGLHAALLCPVAKCFHRRAKPWSLWCDPEQ